jgi:hypothetical protein
MRAVVFCLAGSRTRQTEGTGKLRFYHNIYAYVAQNRSALPKMAGQYLQYQRGAVVIGSGHAICIIFPISISDRVSKISTPKHDQYFILRNLSYIFYYETILRKSVKFDKRFMQSCGFIASILTKFKLTRQL